MPINQKMYLGQSVERKKIFEKENNGNNHMGFLLGK